MVKDNIGKRLEESIRALIILHGITQKEDDDFYYRAYVSDAIDSLAKIVKKWKPELLKNENKH